MAVIDQFTGQIPAKSQAPTVFDANVASFLAYIATLAPQINTAITEILVGADVEVWDVATTYNAPTIVAGSDGNRYACVGTGVLADNPVGSVTGNWVALVLAVDDLSDYSRRDINGFNVTKTGANQLTVSAGDCLDSTYIIPLETTAPVAVTIPSAANTIYHLAAVRLVSDGSTTIQAYASEAAMAADATIDAYRWLIPWCTNGSNNAEEGYSVGPYHVRGKASEAVLSTGITTSYAVVDHSAKVYTARAELIGYGCRDASVSLAAVSASIDGTNTLMVIGLTAATVSDTSIEVWGNSTGIAQGLIPYLSTMQFKSSSGTVDLLARVVKYRR